jgi:MYXO-CTERM domain-containing protein
VGGCSSESQTRTPTPEKTAGERQAIQNADLDPDTKDTFAVGVCGGQKGNCSLFCSGALILPNVVVTARHCVDQSPQQIVCDNNPTFGGQYNTSYYVTTNASMFGGTSSGWHSVKSITTPPDTHVCGNDLAILTLSDLVPSSEATPIIPGVQYPMDDTQYSLRFEAIGYGSTSPQNNGTGQRRLKYRIPIYCIPGSALYDCPTTDGSGNPVNINANEFVGGDGTCEGDSGSSAYDDISYVAGKPVTHGVLSRGGVSTDGTSCQGSLYTRLDKWRDLIVNTANAASSNWTLYPKPNPDWTIYIPPATTPDAGSDASTKPKTQPSGKNIGEQCAQDADCASKMCKDEGDGTLVCTTSCSDSSTCPNNFQCTNSLCLAAPAGGGGGATTTTTTNGGGCTVSRDPTKPTPWRAVLVILGAVVLAVGRRRRSS